MADIGKAKKYIIPIIAILGVITTVKLAVIYYNANFVLGAEPSFCAINEAIDCDAVAKSEYSYFLGVPNAIWGLFFYLFVLTVYMAQRLKQYRFLKFLEVFKNPKSYVFCLSLVSVIVSIILAWVSSHVINKICVLCYVTYFYNILLVFASKDNISILDHFKKSIKDFWSALTNPNYAALAFILAIIGSLSLVYINKTEKFIPVSQKAFKKELKKFQVNRYKISGNILGDINGKVVLHEYTDFQCPFCAISNSMVHRLISEVDNVRIMHHDFPLDKSCNEILMHDGHKNSCLIAKYSLAAKKQGKYWDFNTVTFENNKHISEKKILELAKQVGIDTEKLKQDAYSEEIKNKVSKEINKGISVGITSTPTYRIGMKLYEGLMPYQELKKLVIQAGGIPKKTKND